MPAMDPGILAAHLATLSLSFAVLFAAFRLFKVYRRPFLSDYAVSLLLSAVWTFALWTIPGFVSAAKSPSGGSPALSGLTLMSKWFGFPFHLLQLYFLALTLAGLLEIRVRRSFKWVYAGAAAAASAVIFGGLLARAGGGSRAAFGVLHSQITNAYLLAQALLFAWGGLRAARVEDAERRRWVGLFAWLYLAGFAVYFGVMTWIPTKGATGSLLMGAYHVPPLIALAVALSRGRLGQAAGAEDFLSRLGLTGRERDIVERLLAGRSNRQIAKDLFLSHQTVKNYVSRIYGKLGVSTRLELMNMALRRAPLPGVSSSGAERP